MVGVICESVTREGYEGRRVCDVIFGESRPLPLPWMRSVT